VGALKRNEHIIAIEGQSFERSWMMHLLPLLAAVGASGLRGGQAGLPPAIDHNCVVGAGMLTAAASKPIFHRHLGGCFGVCELLVSTCGSRMQRQPWDTHGSIPSCHIGTKNRRLSLDLKPPFRLLLAHIGDMSMQ
jgi:hypothetical protein